MYQGYTRMGAALRSTGRQFLFSLCEWGGRSPHLWGRKVGGQPGKGIIIQLLYGLCVLFPAVFQ